MAMQKKKNQAQKSSGTASPKQSKTSKSRSKSSTKTTQSKDLKQELHDLLMTFFDRREQEIAVWMKSPNTMLPNYLSPSDMIKRGRVSELLTITKKAIKEHK